MTFRLRGVILATAFSALVLSLSGAPGTADTDVPPTVTSPISTMPSPTPISAPADATTSTPSASPQTQVPDTPIPVSPAPVSPIPVSPAPVSPTPVSPIPVSPTPVSPAPVSPTPVSPIPVSPTPVSPTPVSPTPVSPIPVSPIPVSPAPVSPTPVSPTPAPTETPAYHFIYTPPSPEAVATPTPPGTPQILEIDLTDKTIITPQLVHMRVVTTREVSSVRIAAMGHTLALSQLAPGEFTAQQQLPKMPFYFRNRVVAVQIVAQVDGGRKDAVTIPVILR